MSELIPKHGGYRKLKSFQVALVVYDVTIRFCDRYIDKFSRTRDQMVQAARSGLQNIAEGSQASATLKKSGLCGPSGQDGRSSEPSTESTASTLSTKTYPELSANAALTLLTVACLLLHRQVERLAQDFENEGGFTERLDRLRNARRRNAP